MKKIYLFAIAAVAVCLAVACGNKGDKAQGGEEPAEVSYVLKYDVNALSGSNYEAFKMPRDVAEVPLEVEFDGDKAKVSFVLKIERGEGEVSRDFKDYSYADFSFTGENDERVQLKFEFADDKNYFEEIKGKAAGEMLEIKLVGESTKADLDKINGNQGHLSLWM